MHYTAPVLALPAERHGFSLVRVAALSWMACRTVLRLEFAKCTASVVVKSYCISLFPRILTQLPHLQMAQYTVPVYNMLTTSVNHTQAKEGTKEMHTRSI